MTSPLRRVSALLATTAFVLLAGFSAASAATPPVPLPKSPTGLSTPVDQPSDAEQLAGYAPQVSCDPVPLPGVRRLRDLALATYARGYDGGISRSCTQGGQSEHKEGRAWDWMLDVSNPKDRAVAADFLAWLTAPGPDGKPGLQARRLGVMYVIYNSRIWSSYRANDGWRAYSGSSPHSDHIHLSFTWAGARGLTSFWTGRVAGTDYGRCAVFAGQLAELTPAPRATPCPTPAAPVTTSSWSQEQLGSTRTAPMRSAQARLGVPQTGRFDTATWEAVMAYQRAHELPVTGALDHPTWSSLRPRSVTWNAAAGYTPAAAADHAAVTYSHLVLRRHAAGAPVLFLQTALGMPVADRSGYFRLRTVRAVREFKAAHGLYPNGVVNRRTWRALAAAS